MCMDPTQVPTFGKHEDGEHYTPRPGSYAIVWDRDQVGVMQTLGGFFLPGGGADLGESPEETLRREVREECGYDVDTCEAIGHAIEYVLAAEEGYFAKECSFFRVRLGAQITKPSEADHQLIWMSTGEAVAKLTHKSHSWAVMEAVGKSTK